MKTPSDLSPTRVDAVALAELQLATSRRGDVAIVESPTELLWRLAQRLAAQEPGDEAGDWARRFYGVLADGGVIPSAAMLVQAGRRSGLGPSSAFLPVDGTNVDEALELAQRLHAMSAPTTFYLTPSRDRLDPARFIREIAELRERSGVRSASSDVVVVPVVHPLIQHALQSDPVDGVVLAVGVPPSFVRAVRHGGSVDLVEGSAVVATRSAGALWASLVLAARSARPVAVVAIDDEPARALMLRQTWTLDISRFFDPASFVFLRRTGDGIRWGALTETLELMYRMARSGFSGSPSWAQRGMPFIDIVIGGFADLFVRLDAEYGSTRAQLAARGVTERVSALAVRAAAVVARTSGGGRPAIDVAVSVSPTLGLSRLTGMHSGVEPLGSLHRTGACVEYPRFSKEPAGSAETAAASVERRAVSAEFRGDPGERRLRARDVAFDDRLSLAAALRPSGSVAIMMPIESERDVFELHLQRTIDSGVEAWIGYPRAAVGGAPVFPLVRRSGQQERQPTLVVERRDGALSA